jgi:cell division protein FtsL
VRYVEKGGRGMAQAARKLDQRSTRSRRGAPLRVVKKSPRRAKAPKRAASPRGRASAASARHRNLFAAAVVLLVAFTAIGLVRVAVIARAAEMTISATTLLGEIAQARVEAGKLEVDRSSLSTPSRLEGIASVTLGMKRARSVRYIESPAQGGGPGPTAATTPEASGVAAEAIDPSGGLLGALLDMSAGEAQALLLGDVGLAGSR